MGEMGHGSPAVRHAGIVGAGIAGLTLAKALHGAGIACTVVERASRLDELGAGIQITPNASRLLIRLGLDTALEQVATRPHSIDVRHWQDGRLIARTDLGEDCVGVFGAPYYTMHRADLHRVLLNSIPENSLTLDRPCTAVDEREDAARVTFPSGEAEFDLLVGADGLRSTVRESLQYDSVRFSGYGAYRGIVPADLFPDLRDNAKVRGWVGPDRHFVCYPISGGREIAFSAVTPARATTRRATTLASSSEVVLEYQGWDKKVVALCESAESINWWPLHDRDPLSRWSRERLTLVGDAAHPMLPLRAQGANQAIEDAVVLTDCLRSGHDIGSALQRYERLRGPRTTHLQRSSRHAAKTLHGQDTEVPQSEEMSGRWALRNQDYLFGYKAEHVAANDTS